MSVNFSHVCIIYVKIYEKILSGGLEVSFSICYNILHDTCQRVTFFKMYDIGLHGNQSQQYSPCVCGGVGERHWSIPISIPWPINSLDSFSVVLHINFNKCNMGQLMTLWNEILVAL